MQTIMSLFDNNDPIAIPVYEEGVPITLNKLVFTHDDNVYIPPKGSVTIYTCTWKAYVALRHTLTKIFSGFITIPNSLQYRNTAINRNNSAFCEQLLNPQNELFVIPAHSDSRGKIYPEGGVRLVTDRFIQRGNQNVRNIHIYVGEHVGDTGKYLSDEYFDFDGSIKDPVNLCFV